MDYDRDAAMDQLAEWEAEDMFLGQETDWSETHDLSLCNDDTITEEDYEKMKQEIVKMKKFYEKENKKWIESPFLTDADKKWIEMEKEYEHEYKKWLESTSVDDIDEVMNMDYGETNMEINKK